MEEKNPLNITKKDFQIEWLQNGILLVKKSTSHYKKGKEHRFRKEWDRNGKLTFQGNFVDGNEEIK